MDSELWTLTELTDLVGNALEAAGYAGSGSARANDLPDLRTLRYYNTLKLLDRPAEMRGRTAYYHRRHLLQAVAIKTLQASGLSLQEVQERLINQPDSQLEKITEIPATFWRANEENTQRRARFWAAAPRVEDSASASFSSKPVIEIELTASARLLIERSLTPSQEAKLGPALESLRDALNHL